MKLNRQAISSLFSPAISSVLTSAFVFCLSSTAYAEERDVATSTSTPESNVSLIQTAPAASTVAVELPLDTIAQETDLWNRIRSGYAIPDLDNQIVSNQLNWYSTRTDYIQRTVQRGSRYLYHVVEELEKRGMPTELALLPFIESAFNPQAISTAKASGMWQFMAATGRDFNLKQNMFKDDRRGVLDSTDAALTYLERLHGMFGDWQLALAAYNWGEGSVQRAIKKQQAMGLPIDFESLSALMPNETKNYLPKLQAVKNIIGHPEQFGIELPKLDNQPYFVSVEKTRDIDVRVAAQLAEMSVGDFTALNPQFNRPVITGGSNTKILLPTDNAMVFRDNLSKWNGPLSSWATHTVGKTERIESLANRLGLKPEVLREVNLIPAKMLVKAGSTLLVPKSSKTPDQDISLEIAEKAQLIIEKTPSTRQVSIKVGKRDNLNSIARHYRVSVADVKSWNNLKRDTLTAGQALQIHVPVQQARAKNSRVIVAQNNRGNRNGKVMSHASKIHTTTKIALAKAKPGKKHS
ncbi:transglycosylase SLT domain-containing protein [Undibacterium sp. Xuan67W]|uniref:transglycosylase SLT domain-containing protein n=1 Tax=Undibacterium sp. Xuan67W TaxID=3413057 RepID=UPI003BF2D759